MKHKGFLDKLPKKDIDRHFPEKNGGKGSHARKTTVNSEDYLNQILILLIGAKNDLTFSYASNFR
jgi:hypothetical protein